MPRAAYGHFALPRRERFSKLQQVTSLSGRMLCSMVTRRAAANAQPPSSHFVGHAGCEALSPPHSVKFAEPTISRAASNAAGLQGDSPVLQACEEPIKFNDLSEVRSYSNQVGLLPARLITSPMTSKHSGK